MSDLYSALYAKKGKAYFDSQIVDDSLLKTYPKIDATREIKGNSRISGDIDMPSQHKIIDMLITIGARYKLTYKEISYVLLCAHVESGYNPDAAAGTTTAAGIGQATKDFVDYTFRNSSKRLGFVLDISGQRIFDAELGCYALVFSFLRARDLISDHYNHNDINYWQWLYYLHHDGMNSLRLYHQNKHTVSKDATDCANDIVTQLPTMENLLKNTKIATSFKLSTGDDTPITNKNYIATVSLAANPSCPNIVSGMNNPLIFFKGKTDGEGKTEAINALAGAEIVFTILKDNYKKLAMSGSNDSPEQQKKEKAHKHKSNSSRANADDSATYTVKSGDTLSAIAKSHSTTTDELANLNNLTDANVLHVGQVLKLSNSRKDGSEDNTTIDYISRYVPNDVKQAVMKYMGIENGNAKAAISYSRSHIVLPKGSTSADVDKNKNVVHIKTTTKSAAVKKKQQPLEKYKTDDKGTSKPASTTNEFEPVVVFSVSETLKNLVTSKSLGVIKEIMKTAKVHKVTITSTLRTVQKQVDAMYANMQSKGIPSQLAYYAAAGRDVIKAGRDAGGNDARKVSEVKSAMVDKVISLQKDGELVSKHCVSEEMYAERNVLDISKNSLSRSAQRSFDKALENYSNENRKSFRYISPFKNDGEPAFHIEIVQ